MMIKINRILAFIIIVFSTQLLFSQSSPSIIIEDTLKGEPLDEVKVIDWVLTKLHGGGGDFPDSTSTGISYTGHPSAFGWYSRGDGLNGIGSGMDSGLIISNGRVSRAEMANNNGYMTDYFNYPGDEDLKSMYDLIFQNNGSGLQGGIPIDTTKDAAFLEFLYRPFGDTITLKYVFASEEYQYRRAAEDQYTDFSGYSGHPDQMYDIFGISIDFQSRPFKNLALMPPIACPDQNASCWVNVGNINHNNNSNFYIGNGVDDGPSLGNTFDGQTNNSNALVIRKEVSPCGIYKVKVAIEDFWFESPDEALLKSGGHINSAVFLGGASLSGGKQNPTWKTTFAYEGVGANDPDFEGQLIEGGCRDMLVTFTLNEAYIPFDTAYTIPFRINSELYRDSVNITYIDGTPLYSDSIVFHGGDIEKTIRISVGNIGVDHNNIKFTWPIDPCEKPRPPFYSGVFSMFETFSIRDNSPIVVSADPKYYEAYCKETIDLSIVDETSGGVSPLTYVWPSNPVPPVVVYSQQINNSPEIVNVRVIDGCNNETESVIQINNKPIALQTIPTLSFCAPGMFQEVEASWLPANDFPGYGFVSNLCNWNNITDTPPTSLGNGNPFVINYDNNYIEQIWQVEYNVTDVCGNEASDVFTVDQTGKLDIGDDKYICKGESVELLTFTPSLNDDPNNYTWYEDIVQPANEIGHGPNIIVTPNDTTLYILYILDKCNEVQYDSLVVFVDHFLPSIIHVPTSGEVCPGEIMEFTANTANVWLWTPGGETTQSIIRNETVPGVYTYTLTASSDYCIDKQVSDSYEVFPTPSAAYSFTPDEEACTGEEIQFTYGSDATGKEFQWTFGDGGSSTIPNPVHTYVDPDTYTVNLYVQQYICDNDTNMTVLVNPLPTPDFDADIYEGCLPIDVQFTSSPSQDVFPGATYEWTFGDGSSQSTVANPSHSYTNTGLFNVGLIIYNTERCFAEVIKPNYIQVNPNPTAKLDADPWITTMDTPIIDFFNLSESDSTILNYTWDFGDGSATSGEENPSHTFDEAGDYVITLTIETVNGCLHDTVATVALTEYVQLFIPNAFTPNGDGVNDYFEIKGTPMADYNIYIYNRWGQQIWSTHNFENMWNGEDMYGNPVATGSYIYKIQGTDYQKTAVLYEGTVNVVR